jgi:predicted amidohydrolase YtcJ
MASTSTCSIYTNGIIYTVATDDWDTEPQEAIVVQDGIIKYVGTNEEAYEFDIPGKQT